MKEVWKQIKEYSDYDVSSLGNVRSWKYSNSPRLLRLNKIGRGYLKVSLSKDNKVYQVLVHKLVAAEFLERGTGHNVVDHIDENLTNNAATNLEWCTQRENIKRHYAKNHNKHTCGICISYANHIKDKDLISTK